jgi:hypothetical protein
VWLKEQNLSALTAEEMQELKSRGFSDSQIGRLTGVTMGVTGVRVTFAGASARLTDCMHACESACPSGGVAAQRLPCP